MTKKTNLILLKVSFAFTMVWLLAFSINESKTVFGILTALGLAGFATLFFSIFSYLLSASYIHITSRDKYIVERTKSYPLANMLWTDIDDYLPPDRKRG
ncbi:hypothetical protein SAMN05444141_103634 [Pseudovibrio denitrificans]|uniref:Uncharacterized protein n=1 Tax=Pseudovibrio denitrificans TaxID=258256 RepID=A0A1I7B4P6_9HYPH|nr:hypothetical protein SAMN05444141_103634 [Pseudovibrio denitrificans]